MENLFILDTTFSCDSISVVLNIAKFALRAIQFIVPVLLILWGTIDLVKSVVAGKEDDIKKYQKVLVKRVISAVIVFLIPLLVEVLLGLIGSTSWKTCWENAEPTIISVEDSTAGSTTTKKK